MTRNHETTRLRRYALGALSEEEHVAIEEQYFADGNALEQLSIVEDELIEDYLEDRLDADARERFERHYLSTPGHRARVAVMRRLITTARTARAAAPRESHSPIAATAQTEQPAAWPATQPAAPLAAQHDAPREAHSPIGATAHWSFFQQAALAASIALALALGAAGPWLLNPRRDDTRPDASTPSRPSSPIASSTSPPQTPSIPPTARPSPPPDAPPAPVVVSLSLPAIATRGGPGSDTAVTIPANADTLLLRLETGPDDVPFRRGRAVLRTIERDELWRGPVDTPRNTNATTDASLRALVHIPAAQLRSGDLIVELHGIDQTDASDRESELARYMIRVTLADRPRPR